MPIIKGLEWTFDTVAAAYEKLRPGYMDDLYKMIFDYIPLDRSSCAIEVGIGGGQATLPILETGCNVTAVEYGERFSAICKEKFKNYPNFSVITGRFEDIDFSDNTYDLIYSASAFHWVPEDIGYRKVFSMLKGGGAFARFANHPYRDKGNLPLADEIDRIYDKYYCAFHHIKAKTAPEPEYTEEQAMKVAEIAERYGFTDVKCAVFHRTRSFSAGEYIRLLGTYSDHIAIEENIRKEFFAKIEDAINKHGGVITLYDTIDLQLAMKPGSVTV